VTNADDTSLCSTAFRVWLVAGLALLAMPGAFDVGTPAGPLWGWLVAMPLACLAVLEPCRACAWLVRVSAAPAVPARVQARRR